VHWCLGMYASGSTWLFNATVAVARALFPGSRVSGCFVHAAASLPQDDPQAVRIVKSHDAEPEAALALARSAAAILLTVRDPRDAVVSLMQSQRYRFLPAVAAIHRSAHYCAVLAPDRRTRIFRYESGFTDDPATAVAIAATFAARLAEPDRARIHAALRRPAIEALIAGLPDLPGAVRDPRSGDFEDPVTQWHTHHAGRDGRIGKWRDRLTPEQAAFIDQRLRPTMAILGYPASTPP